MRTTIQADKLKALFQAFRERNEETFVRIAERIIDEEVAANHHGSATELKRALGTMPRSISSISKVADISSLPLKDRRSGEELLSFIDTPRSPVVILSPTTQQQIDRVVEEQRRSSLLRAHGYAPKNKLLFWGPPGCGKTLTAQYLAYELSLPFAVVRLNAVISSFLGDTASHLHRIVSRADHTPMVLLLDEADALAKQRDDPNDVGELKRVVNSFLQALDAFAGQQSILIAASNHQYLFDPALWRRFDAVVEFGPPDLADRQRFLKYLMNGVQFEGSIADVARRMSALSYSAIQSVTVEATKTMLLADKRGLTSRDLLKELVTWKTSVRKAQARGSTRTK